MFVCSPFVCSPAEVVCFVRIFARVANESGVRLVFESVDNDLTLHPRMLRDQLGLLKLVPLHVFGMIGSLEHSLGCKGLKEEFARRVLTLFPLLIGLGFWQE